MLASALSNDTWLGVAFIAAITVVSCLGFMAKVLQYEMRFIDVVSGLRVLRKKIDEDQQVEEIPVPTPPPVREYEPDATDSIDSVESTDSDESIETSPDATEPAEAEAQAQAA